jgi:peptidoglycan/LPS O-acetylase OafA/YrhL
MSLGSWRFFLALLVAVSHLWEQMIHGPAAYAVWGFFLISGYLMTHILKTRYADGLRGLGDYAINRFLRIYPAYWIACLFGWVALILMPLQGVNPAVLNAQFVMPGNWRDWLTNIGLLPLWGAGNLLVPVSSALGIEVGVYLLMPLLARAPAAAWLGLVLSALLNGQYGLEPQSFALRYSQFLTCFMAFAAGSLVSHYQQPLSRLAAPRASTLAWLAHSLLWLVWDAWPWTLGLYVSLPLTAWVLVSFCGRKPSAMDRWLGDLSYPVYLFHSVMAVWWMGYFGLQRSWDFMLTGLAGTLVLSCAVVMWVDRPLERFKRRRVAVRPAKPTGLRAL